MAFLPYISYNAASDPLKHEYERLGAPGRPVDNEEWADRKAAPASMETGDE